MDEYVKELPLTVEPIEPTNDVPAAADTLMVPAEAISDLFGIRGEMNSKQRQWLGEVVAWAKEQGKDLSDIKWAIIQKKNSLGSPALGTTQLEKFMQWLTAFNGYKRAKDNLRSVEGV